MKIQSDESSSRPFFDDFSQYYVPAQRKWEAIFRQCSQNLGLTLDNALWSREDMLRAWEHIAVVVSQMKSPGKSSSARTHKVHRGRKGSSASSKSDLKMEQRLFAESCEVLQCIPDYGREQLDPDQLKKIEIYLQTVCSIFPQKSLKFFKNY